MRVDRRLAVAIGFFLTVSSGVASAAETMTRLETFGDWSVLADATEPHSFCFVTSEPKSTDPDGTTREAPRAYISAWPKDGIRGEVSFRMGFTVEDDGTAKIGASEFKLFGSSDRVYVKDSTQELKLVEAMRKGSMLSVAAASGATSVTDTYSLSGVGQALQKMQESCF